MKHLAAYMLAVLGGKAMPTAKDVKDILAAVDATVDDVRLDFIIEEMRGKNVFSMIAEGRLIMDGSASRGAQPRAVSGFKFKAPLYPGTSVQGTAQWGAGGLLSRPGRYSIEEDKSNTTAELAVDKPRFPISDRSDPHFGHAVVSSLRQHSFALVRMSEAEKEGVSDVIGDNSRWSFFPVSGGRMAAHIPVHPHTSTAVLPELADSILEAMFVELSGREADRIREDLAPCFSSTRGLGLGGAPSTASLLTSFKCPNMTGLVNTRAHFDRGLITLAVSDRNDGLQVLDATSDEWLNVETAGCVVVMAGQMLPFAAPGLFDACKHRVVSLPRPRISLTYKVRPSRDWLVSFPPLSPSFLPDGWPEVGAGTLQANGDKDGAVTAGEMLDLIKGSINAELCPMRGDSDSDGLSVADFETDAVEVVDQTLPRSWQPLRFNIEMSPRRFTCRVHTGLTVVELRQELERLLRREAKQRARPDDFMAHVGEFDHQCLVFRHGGSLITESTPFGEIDWALGDCLEVAWEFPHLDSDEEPSD